MCGEYGENFERPHYHCILFNHEFDDKYFWRFKNGYRCYRSETLENFGLTEIAKLVNRLHSSLLLT